MEELELVEVPVDVLLDDDVDDDDELVSVLLAAGSFLVDDEPLSLLSASRVEPNEPAERLSVL